MTVPPIRRTLDPARLRRLGTHFQRYVDDGRLPGWHVRVGQGGRVVYDEMSGYRDIEAKTPWTDDTIVRLYSNTKIVTAVAAMMLWEEGAFELRDPLHAYIPSFANTRVYKAGYATNPVTDPVMEPIRIWHLFSHTSGLTYGFLRANTVDEVYRNNGFELGDPPSLDSAGVCDLLASLPLCFQPGTEWNYGMSTDVLGRLVEVCSGLSLGEFFRTRIFESLGMTDTAFHCPPEKHERLAALYSPFGPGRTAVRVDAMGDAAKAPRPFESGGGGLVGTVRDYHRLLEMLRGNGEVDGVRLLSPAAVEMMSANHLPGGVDLTAFGRTLFAETTFDGVGFGLAVSVTIDPVKAKVPGSVGDYGWGGLASTWALIDPVQDLTVFFATQLVPSSTWPIRSQIRPLLHQALL